MVVRHHLDRADDHARSGSPRRPPAPRRVADRARGYRRRGLICHEVLDDLLTIDGLDDIAFAASAKRAEHVVMLQRSPTYMFSWPDEDAIANFLRKVLPEKLAYRITRWKNIRMQTFIFRFARKRPKLARRFQ